MTPSEKEAAILALIRRCKRYDRSAQFELYKRFYRFGIGICLRYAQTEDEAREVLNDGFYRIFTNIEKYDEAYTFVTWARTIFVRTSIDHLRKQKNKLAYDEVEEAGDISVPDSSIDWMNAQEAAHLIQQLPPQYRAVFNLYEVDGHTHEEIGQLLGISTGTSKSNLARARQKLKGIVQDYLKSSDLTNYER
ncbi:MAG: sigma-70 family RNA polymerase sigma factor [Lewinellaceae bacterium]|nr:sigma-70 family RNA polymerase sigma factor [Saprospiraceae bacterium]MCB9337053.1 sigma-70 family RNA polymerase sigma factor [Lewinellaceae bacterium]